MPFARHAQSGLPPSSPSAGKLARILRPQVGQVCRVLLPIHRQFTVAEMWELERGHLMSTPKPFVGYVERLARVSTCLVAAESCRCGHAVQIAQCRGQALRALNVLQRSGSKGFVVRVHSRCARLLIGAHQRIKRTRKTHQPQCRLTHGRSGIDHPIAVGHAHNFGFFEPKGARQCEVR